MNRWLGLVALVGLVGGCATAVEDPIVPEPPPEPQKDPPSQTLNGELPQPSSVTGSYRRDMPKLPPRQKAPLPFEQEAN